MLTPESPAGIPLSGGDMEERGALPARLITSPFFNRLYIELVCFVSNPAIAKRLLYLFMTNIKYFFKLFNELIFVGDIKITKLEKLRLSIGD